MIIFRRDEDIAIKSTDLGGPCFGVRLGILTHYRWHRLVEERQVEIFNVHEFELGVGALLCDFVNPFSHGLSVATGPCASDDDSNSSHKFLLLVLMFSVCAHTSIFEPSGQQTVNGPFARSSDNQEKRQADGQEV